MDSSAMLEIAISEFVSGETIPVDLYMKLGGGKFLCIARRGAKTQLKNLSVVQNKSLNSVFVRKDEYHEIISQTLRIVEIATQASQLKNEHKTLFLRNAVSAVFTQIESFGASPHAIGLAKEVSTSTIQLVAAQPRLTDILKGLKAASSSVFNQSIATSIFSVMIAQKMGWSSKVTIEKLALGGMLAEIGLKELPTELINKPRSEMSFEEVQRYEEHPFRSMKILESVENIPSDVLSIVYEHHENAMGLGYPRRLRDIRMNPLARVVAVATCFCELTVPNPANPAPKPLVEALKHMEVIMGSPFNKEAMVGLRALIEEEVRKALPPDSAGSGAA